MKQRILLKGKDGIDLLQRITTLDFTRLLPQQSQTGLILNPQGKIICFFEATLSDQKNEVKIDFEGNSFLPILDQYTFAEKYQIEKLAPPSHIENSVTESNRILARTPKEGKEFLPNGETNPLEINLFCAIHDQKGCYPGQEVVEKIISLGSPAKKLCLVKMLDSSGKSTFQLPLEFDEGIGKLTSFESPYGLAIIRKTHTSPQTILKVGTHNFQVIES